MFPIADDGYFCADLASHYVETWKAMEALKDEGLTMSIGLSNFNRNQVQEILAIPGLKHRPAILQNESHPYLHEKDLRDFCRINNIIFQVTLCARIYDVFKDLQNLYKNVYLKFQI